MVIVMNYIELFFAFVIGFFLCFLLVKGIKCTVCQKDTENCRNCENKDCNRIYSFLYNEFLLFLTPLFILIVLFLYSLKINSNLLALLFLCLILSIIFMENTLKRRKFPNAAFDILIVKFFERSSYILLALGFIIGILYTAKQLQLIK